MNASCTMLRQLLIHPPRLSLINFKSRLYTFNLLFLFFFFPFFLYSQNCQNHAESFPSRSTCLNRASTHLYRTFVHSSINAVYNLTAAIAPSCKICPCYYLEEKIACSIDQTIADYLTYLTRPQRMCL